MINFTKPSRISHNTTPHYFIRAIHPDPFSIEGKKELIKYFKVNRPVLSTKVNVYRFYSEKIAQEIAYKAGCDVRKCCGYYYLVAWEYV